MLVSMSIEFLQNIFFFLKMRLHLHEMSEPRNSSSGHVINVYLDRIYWINT